MKTLLYLASGAYQDHYDKLPYELLILVDRCIRTQISLRGAGFNEIVWHVEQPQFSRKRDGDIRINLNWLKARPQEVLKIILQLGMDALKGLELLGILNIKIDALVSVNEGLYEGGGEYPLLTSGLVMGYALPLFQRNLILVCNPSYYPSKFQRVFRRPSMWGYQKTELNVSYDNYLLPERFTKYGMCESGKVFMLSKKPDCMRYRFNKMNLLLFKESIWCDYNLLDVLVFPKEILSYNSGREFNMQKVTEFLFSRKKVCTVDYSNLDDLLSVTARLNSNKMVGMVAHSFFENPENLRRLTSRNFTERATFQEVRFYCLTSLEFQTYKKALDNFLTEEPPVY